MNERDRKLLPETRHSNTRDPERMSEATLEPGVIGNGRFDVPADLGGRVLSRTCSHVDPIIAAMRLSRSWQEAS